MSNNLEYILPVSDLNRDPIKMREFDYGILPDLLERASHPSQGPLRSFLKEVNDFRKIPGLPYLVSDCGRAIKIFDEGCEIGTIGAKGYCYANINWFGKHKFIGIHRLVMIGFFGDQEDMVVNHIDGNPSNNHLWNLEWVKPGQNIKHAINFGLSKVKPKGRKKFSEEQIQEMCTMKKSGMILKDISEYFGVSSSTVQKIVTQNISGKFDWFKRNA